MLILKLYPVDCQFQETRSMFLGNFFPPSCFFVHEFSAKNFREVNRWKQLIPRKSFKAVYVTTAISNNVHGNKFLPSILNISSTWAKVGSDQLINLSGRTWHLYWVSCGLVSVIFSRACFSRARLKMQAFLSFFLFFFCQWDLVCRPRVPSGGHGNWG